MNGADVLCQTLLDNDIDTCFANPGTSEMHFVAALDDKPQMRCVLGLFEGVVTGAADGYARMTGRPASTLLHTGPGLANGLANLHNARRAGSPMVNIVGDHSTGHLIYDAPLTTDIEALAGPMSDWVGRVKGAATIQADTLKAISHAQLRGGQVATLILPADAAWGKSQYNNAAAAPKPHSRSVDEKDIQEAVSAIRKMGSKCLILLGGNALRPEAMGEAARIAKAFGVTVMAEQANARMSHGVTSFAPVRVPYSVDQAVQQLSSFNTVILIGARSPVAFFKFPEKPHRITPPECHIISIADASCNLADVVISLREELGLAPSAPYHIHEAPQPEVAQGALTGTSVVQTVAALIPENAIICDEAISFSHSLGLAARGAAPHDLLQLTGGAIGIGPSLSVGAAIACPDRRVINVQADGSAMYTVQALWTQAREALNITTIVLSNRQYACLYDELANMGRSRPGKNAQRMMDLEGPAPDWLALAKGFGVPAVRVETAEALAREISCSLTMMGPSLIEAVISSR